MRDRYYIYDSSDNRIAGQPEFGFATYQDAQVWAEDRSLLNYDILEG